jgi:hypothetical protein
MRWRSAGFVIAMVIGGVLYDPKLVNYFLPVEYHLSKDFVHRLPVALVLFQAFVCLFFTLRMVEPTPKPKDQTSVGSTVSNTLRLTFNTARWVLTNPVLLVVILIGVAIDSIVRNFATINSSYFRMIDLPEWTYGFIGAAMGLLAWFVPAIAERLNNRFSMLANLGFTAVGTSIGLVMLVPMWPIYGVLPAIFLMTMMGFLGFTLSRVLHQEADSARRATVLSVKGLIFNLGYGLFSLGFSMLLATAPDASSGAALQQALKFQIPYFLVLIVVLFFWAKIFLKAKSEK